MRSGVFVVSFAAASLSLGIGSPARADVSSWVAVDGGYALQRDRRAATNQFAPTMTYTVGVGTSPLSSVVLGGIVRGTTFFGLGTDLGVALRATTGAFARGDWGAALDIGAVWRYWRGGSYGDWPAQAVLTVGSPWGFEIAAGTEFASLSGQRAALGGFVTLGIDLLRLTVMRQGATERWWYNPAPAGGHQATSNTSTSE